jgi:hypothetical protein
MKKIRRWFRRLTLLEVNYLFIDNAGGGGIKRGYLIGYVAVPGSYEMRSVKRVENAIIKNDSVRYLAIIEPMDPDPITKKYNLLTVESDKLEIV